MLVSQPDGRVPWGRIAIIWLIFAVLLLAINFRNIAESHFFDPDDVLRLVQVRDLLAGQAWFDLHQYRIDPGASHVMHWSRIVDAPIALVILLLRPLLGQPLAEHIAVILVPLLTFGAIMAVIGRMAFRLFDRETASLACLACGLSPLLLAQVQPLRIDHHGWQIVTVILALSALMHRRPGLAGAMAGAAIATGLSISLEVLPLAAAFGAVLLLRWLRDPAAKWGLANYLASLAAGLVVWFGLTRGPDFIQYCDAISPAYLAFFVWVGAGSLAIAAWPKLPPAAIVGLLGVTGAAGAALFLFLAPQCSSGPFGNLDPLVREYWFVNVFEGQPFWKQRLDQAIPLIAQGLLALAVTFQLWRRSNGATRTWWLEYLLVFGAAIAAGLLVWRSMAFVGAISAVPIGWLLHRLLARYRLAAAPLKQLGIGLAALIVLLPATPVVLAKKVLPERLAGEAHAAVNGPACNSRESAQTLARLPPTIIFAPLDMGPTLLERTPHSVIATSHHRAQLAMHDVILAFTSPAAQAETIVKRHDARYLVICTDLVEAEVYAAKAPHGLMAQLLAGKAPAWLKKVPVGGPKTFQVWQVVD